MEHFLEIRKAIRSIKFITAHWKNRTSSIVWKFEFLDNFHTMEMDKSIEIATSNLFPYYFHTMEEDKGT
jgi:hypothetical protein